MSNASAAADSATSQPKWVYRFGGGTSDGTADMRDLLGGKGANLAEMASLGLPVPPGFTLTTEVCTTYYAGGRKLPSRPRRPSRRRRWPKSAARSAPRSAMQPTRCSSPCAPARAPPCPA